MGISLPHALIYQPWCSCAHLLSWTSASRGLPPHTLSHLPAVGLMRSSAVVGIVLSRSAPSPTLSLSSTSSGAHALICCRGHRPLEVSSLPDSLIYQLWCSCAHLLSWTSSSRGLSLPHTLSSTSCGAHALICCRGHPPLVVCPLPHALSHLLAVVLMCSSAVVDIVPSRSAPFPHTLSSTSRGAHAPICCRGHRPLVACSLPSHTLSSTSCGAHALICYRGHRPLEVYPLSPHTLSATSSGALPSGGESSVSLALSRASE